VTYRGVSDISYNNCVRFAINAML